MRLFFCIGWQGRQLNLYMTGHNLHVYWLPTVYRVQGQWTGLDPDNLQERPLHNAWFFTEPQILSYARHLVGGKMITYREAFD